MCIRDSRNVHVLDLHGNTKKKEVAKDGTRDVNVFDIQQGVAISLLVAGAGKRELRHADLYGERATKYRALQENTIATTPWTILRPATELLLWRPFDATNTEEYSSYCAITEVFNSAGDDGRGSCWAKGLATTKDHLFISFDRAEALEKIGLLASRTASDKQVAQQLELEDTPYFTISGARALVRDGDFKSRIRKVTYRPFDTRIIYWHPELYDVGRGASSKRVMSHLWRPNIALVTSRMTKGESFAHAFVSRVPVEVIGLSSKTSNNAFVFPLRLYPDRSAQLELNLDPDQSTTNLSPTVMARMARAMGVSRTKSGMPAGLTPEEVFQYVYAILFSPSYRVRYAEFLKVDFPRLPVTPSHGLLQGLARLGGELQELHLLEAPIVDKPITEFVSGPNCEVEKIVWSESTVWVNRAQTTGFKGVSEDVWNFHIGGYQVCEKWLKDRKGRRLTRQDCDHYQKIVVALSETLRLMGEIDELIEQHGGWPGAFV